MESTPHMEARPPALIEAAVRLLVPPAAREHVLGDLAEQYTSPGRYVFDAFRTLPFVVISQIRRTSYFFALWPMIGLILAFCFSPGPDTGVGFWRGVVPAVATLVGFMLRDAYRVLDLERPWRQGLIDVGCAALAVVLSQAVVAIVWPAWLVTPAGAAGGALCFGVLYLLRVQNPTRSVPRQIPAALPGATMTYVELRGEMRVYERGLRRGGWIEVLIACAMVPVFANMALSADEFVVRLGGLLTVAGLLIVVAVIGRSLRRSSLLSRDDGFATTLAEYLNSLQRYRRALSTMWLWYFLPLGVGPIVIMAGAFVSHPRPLAAAGVVLLYTTVAVSVVRHVRGTDRGLRTRIAALSQVRERS